MFSPFLKFCSTLCCNIIIVVLVTIYAVRLLCNFSLIIVHFGLTLDPTCEAALTNNVLLVEPIRL